MVSKSERSEATRNRLIRHGAQLFARQGYDGTSLDSIAEAAQVNKAMVKYHFKSKQGLYSAVLLASIRKAASKLAPARNTSLAPPDRLSLFIACLMDAFKEAPEFPFIILREEMSGGYRIEDDVLKEFVGFFELDREILMAGMASGTFKNVDPHEVHLSIVGSLGFFLASQPLRQARTGKGQLPDAPEVDSYVEYITRLFLKGLSSS